MGLPEHTATSPIRGNDNINLLVVSTYLENISQNGDLPQFSSENQKIF